MSVDFWENRIYRDKRSKFTLHISKVELKCKYMVNRPENLCIIQKLCSTLREQGIASQVLKVMDDSLVL